MLTQRRKTMLMPAKSTPYQQVNDFPTDYMGPIQLILGADLGYSCFHWITFLQEREGWIQ